MLKKSFTAVFLIVTFVLSVLSAEQLIFPNPVIPELTLEDQKTAEISLQSRREVAKKILRTYTETYNSEFRSKNKVSINPIHPDTLTQVLKSVDSATEAQLIDGRMATIQALKKQYDEFALKTYDLAKQETINQIKFLGVTTDEIIAFKKKLIDAETKNLELANQVAALQAEITELKKTIILLQDQNAKVTAPAAVAPTEQQPAVVQAAPAVPQPAVTVPSKSGMTKIVVLILLGLAVAFVILKSRSN